MPNERNERKEEDKSSAGQAGAEHDWARLLEKFEDVPASLNVPEEVRRATLADLHSLVRLEDVKATWMDLLRDRCSELSKVQLEIDQQASNVMGQRLQKILGGELADLHYDKTTTHPISLLSGCDLDEHMTVFSRLHAWVKELTTFQPDEVAASEQQIDANKLRIEALTVEVDHAQGKLEEARRFLTDATARTSGLERQLEDIRREKFNAVKCSLQYCTEHKLTREDGGNGKMGTCGPHCNLIASIASQPGVNARDAWEYMASNGIGADVLRRARDRDNRDKEARLERKEYLKRARER